MKKERAKKEKPFNKKKRHDEIARQNKQERKHYEKEDKEKRQEENEKERRMMKKEEKSKMKIQQYIKYEIKGKERAIRKR